jgi:replicative DNA helicase
MVYTVVKTSSEPNREDSTTKESPQAGDGFWNLDFELQAIKTILTPNSQWGIKLYTTCKPEFFHHTATKTIFLRIRELLKESDTFELPTLKFVLSDSNISPTVKDTLKDAFTSGSVYAIEGQGDYDILMAGLARLAKTRALYQLTHKAASELIDSDAPSDMVKSVSDQLGESLFKLDDTDDSVITQVTMGRGYNQQAEDSFTRIVNGSFEEVKIKTGYTEFDERTGGFHRTNLVVMGANSGGGKSLMAVNLLIRQYRLGYNTILCSYEMTDDEVMVRVISNISEVGMTKLQTNRINGQEIEQAHAAWREFNLQGYNQGNSYHILCPKTETSVPEIGFRVRSLQPDVLILDYINLLTSSTGADEAHWLQLGNIAREAKLLANKLNCVVILLAQIDDMYNLRYSKSIKDHANFVMSWIRGEEAIIQRQIVVKQQKARNAELYEFSLGERFDIAQFRDPEQDDRLTWPSKDELLKLEMECRSKGLMLEATVSKDFDKKSEETKLVKANLITEDEVVEIDADVLDDEAKDTASSTAIPPKKQETFLFSEEDMMLQDFSQLPVKSSPTSLLKNNPLYEDTV